MIDQANGCLPSPTSSIRRGAEIEARDDEGQTALHVASQFGQVGVFGLLIEQGAEIEARENRGHTALHVASEYGKIEITRSLIERGADIEARDDKIFWKIPEKS